MIIRKIFKTEKPFLDCEYTAIVKALSHLLAIMNSTQASMLRDLLGDDEKREFLDEYLQAQVEAENDDAFEDVAKRFVDYMFDTHERTHVKFRKEIDEVSEDKVNVRQLKKAVRTKERFIYELAKKYSKSDFIKDREVQKAAKRFLKARGIKDVPEEEKDSKAQG